MSWWIGLDRDEFVKTIETHKFNPASKVNHVSAIDDDPMWLHRMYRSKGNPWRAHDATKRRKEAGFVLNTGGQSVLTRDRDGQDSTYEQYVEVPTECTKEIRTIEADRAYLEWKRTAYMPPWDVQQNHQYLAVEAAAELLVLLNHGYQPKEWLESEFRSWVERHKDQVEQQLRMLD